MAHNFAILNFYAQYFAPYRRKRRGADICQLLYILSVIFLAATASNDLTICDAHQSLSYKYRLMFFLAVFSNSFGKMTIFVMAS